MVRGLPGRGKKPGRVGTPRKRDEKDAQKREALGRDPKPKRRASLGLFRLFCITELWGRARGEFKYTGAKCQGGR